jgi:hypothetical protein
VTDLGTEFGVQVSWEGLTQVHVLQGVVETSGIGEKGHQQQQRQRLTEGKAVEIGRKGGEIKSVAFAPQLFARSLQRMTSRPSEAAYIKAVLADKPLGYWPLNEPRGSSRFTDRSGHGFHGQAMGKVGTRQADFFRGGSRVADFDGQGCIDMGRRDEFASLGAFTIETWVSIGAIPSYGRVFSAVNKQSTGSTGWALTIMRLDSEGLAPSPVAIRLVTYGGSFFYFRVPTSGAAEGRWLHLALVFDGADTMHFYLNGEYQESVRGQGPRKGQWAWVGIGSDPIDPGEYWRGGLGHLAVYPYALGTQQIRKHFDQRDGGQDQ